MFFLTETGGGGERQPLAPGSLAQATRDGGLTGTASLRGGRGRAGDGALFSRVFWFCLVDSFFLFLFFWEFSHSENSDFFLRF